MYVFQMKNRGIPIDGPRLFVRSGAADASSLMKDTSPSLLRETRLPGNTVAGKRGRRGRAVGISSSGKRDHVRGVAGGCGSMTIL